LQVSGDREILLTAFYPVRYTVTNVIALKVKTMRVWQLHVWETKVRKRFVSCRNLITLVITYS